MKGAEYAAFSELVFVMSWAASARLLSAAVACTAARIDTVIVTDDAHLRVCLSVGAWVSVVARLR